MSKQFLNRHTVPDRVPNQGNVRPRGEVIGGSFNNPTGLKKQAETTESSLSNLGIAIRSLFVTAFLGTHTKKVSETKNQDE